MAITFTRVEGRDAGKVRLYALSTCVWCKRTKRLLGELGVAYEYVDVDLLAGEDRRQTEREVRRWNPQNNFPTIVVDDRTCIAGFNEEKMREAFEG